MLDLKFIRENRDRVSAAIKCKRQDADLDLLLSLDEKRRKQVGEVDSLKEERNRFSAQIPQMKKEGKDVTSELARMKQVSDKITQLDKEVREMDEQIKYLLLRIPNVPHQSVPIGENDSANQVVRQWGRIPKFEFDPKTHWELGERLGLFDLTRGAKLAGSGFVLFTNRGARLVRALIAFMLDLHTKEHGYQEVWPPSLVNRVCMTGTGQLPKLEEDMYLTEKDDLFLIPTAEVPVSNIHREEILKVEDLPIRYTAYTPCFRREAGAYGKDTKGLTRIHQFDKVELVKFVQPEDSYDELEKLVQNAEKVLQLLELPYQIKLLCSGDMSFAAAKCYDLEVWAAGVQKYLEVSSCSNFEDFQARRMEIKYRPKAGATVRLVHTLNGSGLALPRTIIGLLENNQTAQGTVTIPSALRPYLDDLDEIS